MDDLPINKMNNIKSIKSLMKIELMKNKILQELIKIKKEEINMNKYNLSELSIILKKQKNKINTTIIKEELNKANINILKNNQSLKKQIEFYQNEYNDTSNLLEKNTEQLKYIKITADEQFFILENKLKEKNCLIKVIKNIILQLTMGFTKFELIQEIDNDYYKKEEGFDKKTETILKDDRELWNQFFLFNLMKQNRIINQNKKLNKEINILSEFISQYKNKKLTENDNNLYDSNDMIVQTNISTDDSISNDSLLLDTDEQFDIEFTRKDIFSEQKNIKIKNDNNKNNNISIPPLDLRLINFNNQNDLSYKEKSLSRNLMFELSDDKLQDEKTIEENIEKVKRLIKYFKKKNKILERKIKKYENKISKFSLILSSKC